MDSAVTTHRPSVSVGMPVRNGAQFIAKAIESVLAQTYEDFELVISDNDSDDDTREICLKYARSDPRVRYHRSLQNIGASPNFNRVFDLSSGDFFRWQPADDLCAPTLVERCKAALDANPNAALCCSKTVLISETGAPIRPCDDMFDLRHPRARDRFRTLLMNLKLCNAQFGLMRSAMLRRTGLEGSYPGSDIVLLAELALHGPFLQLDEPLYYRRLHRGAHSSITSAEGQQQFADPRIKRRFFSYHWTHILGHWRAIKRAPLRLSEKAALFFDVTKIAWWSRKHLFQEAGAGLATMKQMRPAQRPPTRPDPKTRDGSDGT